MTSEVNKRNTIFPGSRGWSDHFEKITSSSSRGQSKPSSDPSKAKLRDHKKNRSGSVYQDQKIQGSSKDRQEDREITSESKLVPTNLRDDRTLPIIKASELSAPLLEPPWKKYQRLYKLQFGDSIYFTVAQDYFSSRQGKLVIFQNLFDHDAENQVRSIQQIRHPRFLAYREVFFFEDSFAVAFDFLPLSLAELAGNPLLDELRLASIMGQIIDGLSYLEKNGLEHSQLTCSNILLDSFGNVKIWGYQRSKPWRGQDIKSLSSILMELMQGYTKEDGAVGVDDLSRWPSDSRAVDFLSMTTYATEISQLLDHALLQLPWHPSLLEGVASLANIWASRGYKYPA